MESDTYSSPSRTTDSHISLRKELSMDSRARSIVFPFAVALFSITGVAAGGPISDSIQVGDVVTGSFKYDVAQAPADSSDLSFRGEYRFADPNSFIEVTIGEHKFSSAVGATFIPSRPGHVTVIVDDLSNGFDDIQISGIGDEASFAPFVSFLSRQDPNFVPLGTIGLTFILPPYTVFSDALPTFIDASSAFPFGSFAPIFGGVEGVSTQPPDEGLAAATREWFIFFEVEPRDVSIVNDVVSGTFVGRVTLVDDFTQQLPPSEMLDVMLQQVTGVGPGRSLEGKIETARAHFLAADLPAACASLHDFSAHVGAQEGNKIPSATAKRFLARAAAIRLAIACE